MAKLHSETPAALRVAPFMENSLRARVVRYRVARTAARAVVHTFPGAWNRICGSYAGVVDVTLHGIKLRYALGPDDPIGDGLYWAGGRNWEPEVVPSYCRLAQAAKGRVLDVGANCGVYSLLACAVNPTVRVIAWEPLPHCRERLLLSAGYNGFTDRIECRDAAVGSAAGTANFYLHDDPTMGSFTDHSSAGRPMVVRVEAIDDIVREPVDLVKIDVEGHEHDALQGMTKLLDRCHPAVIFECLWDSTWGPIRDLFHSHGYKLFVLRPSGPSEASEYCKGSTNYLAEPA